jgi:hypothetical protein
MRILAVVKGVAVVGVLVGVLSACGTLAGSNDRIVQDGDYIAQVNYAAQQRGVQVTWVNPPTKREKKDDKAAETKK